MDAQNTSNTENNVSQHKHFFKKIISGDYSLAKTFWLYGVLIPIIVILSLSFIYFFAAISKSIGIMAIYYIIALCYLAYSVCINIGIWAAANKFQGARLWAILAKVVVCFWWINLFAGILYGLLVLSDEALAGMPAA